MKKKVVIFITILVLVINFPLLLAYILEGDDFLFRGILFNPIDGATYLAKMRLGWEGNWLYTLPFTAEPGKGVFLFTYYLFLGHVSRWTGLGVIWIFHIARVFNSLLFFSSFFIFIDRLALDDETKWRAFFIGCTGSGLGWLMLLSGYQSSDLWISEAYPFLSNLANPHFPLGLTLILMCLYFVFFIHSNKWQAILLFFCTLLLGIVLPFGVVVAGIIVLLDFIYLLIEKRQRRTIPLLIMGICGGGLLLLQYASVIGSPEMSSWNLQNLTITPPVWDVFLSNSPMIIFAVPGIIVIFKDKNGFSGRFFLWWLLACGLLMYFPSSLQRRFMTGLYIPISVLGAIGLTWFSPENRRKIWSIASGLSWISNILVLVLIIGSLSVHNSSFYLQKSQASVMKWIEENSETDSLVLCNEQMGLLIPAYTGRRVVYGHPYETVDAEKRLAQIHNFFGKSSDTWKEQFIHEISPDYILISNENEGYSIEKFRASYDSVYENNAFKLYSPKNRSK